MIGQYLSNTNENATVSILQKFLELNKAVHAKFSAITRLERKKKGNVSSFRRITNSIRVLQFRSFNWSLNKHPVMRLLGSCLVPKKFYKIFQTVTSNL